MLQAKTKEQREHVESIVKKHIHHLQDCCFFEDAKVYLNCQELVEINLTCLDCDSSICVDIPFDMMAEIVEYLREQNKESNVTWNDQRNTKQKTCKGIG